MVFVVDGQFHPTQIPFPQPPAEISGNVANLCSFNNVVASDHIPNPSLHPSEKTFLNDATHIWNMAPETIKNCESIYRAKKAIKDFVKTLPV